MVRTRRAEVVKTRRTEVVRKKESSSNVREKAGKMKKDEKRKNMQQIKK